MPRKRLLLLSNATNAGASYLSHAQGALQDFLSNVPEVLFVPFAGVSRSYDAYTEQVREHFKTALGYRVNGLHEAEDPLAVVEEAEALVVGGGNTFHLLRGLCEAGVLEAIRERVEGGLLYVGWSAGANVACPTLATTNDMPIVEPPSFRALDLIPFQINPHYLDVRPPDYAGESRAERLQEFTAVNPDQYVVGLREGSILRCEADTLALLGERPIRVFKQGEEPADYKAGEDLDFLLQLENKGK